MKVSVLARPDHSTGLVTGLRQLGVDVDYHTFYAVPEGGLLQRLLPSRKTVPAGTRVHCTFTAVAYPLIRFTRRLPYNWRATEKLLGDVLLRPAIDDDAEIVHYWPFYFAKTVEGLKAQRRGLVTIADYYEAEPSAVNAVFRAAYDQVGLRFQRPINELIDQNVAFKFETNFIVPSEYTRRTYAARFPSARIHVVDYGMAGLRLSHAPRAIRKRTRWVYVGRISIEKGVHVLLDVMERHPELQLDLIGGIDDEQREYFARRFASIANVRHLRQQRRTQVLAQLPEYDGFVMPSLSDAYSIATVEALCAGLPVVVTNHCGVAERVAYHGLGEVAEAASVDSLERAMLAVTELVDADELASGLREFEREEMARPYAQRVLDVYQSIGAGNA